MSIAIKRIKRAIAGVPTGRMQTGKQHIKLEYSDAQRAIAEIEGLTAERNELAVQVEVLQSWVKQAAELVNVDAGTAIDWLIDAHHQMLKDAKTTPAACLAQVQADAGRAGFIAGFYTGVNEGEDCIDSCFFNVSPLRSDQYANQRADQYAERIRQGVE